MEEKTHYPDFIEHKHEFLISKGQSPERLDVFLTHSIHNASRNKVQMAISAGKVCVNGKAQKASYKVSPLDKIECIVMQRPPIELIPENIPLNIVYEDEHLLVVNKSAGMCVHPGVGNRYGTLLNALLFHLGIDKVSFNLEDEDEDNATDNEDVAAESLIDYQDVANIRAGIVHRIDKDTSGLMVVAKTLEVHTNLSRQFAAKTTEREYYAIVWGKPKQDNGRIEGNIGRSTRDRTSFAIIESGRHAVTDYWVLERFAYTALVKFKLLTGRTHQIRVHAGSIGHKLFGDVRYGGNQILYGKENPQWKSQVSKLFDIATRQMLHAKTLGFVHPITKEKMVFDSELPEDMMQVLGKLRY